MITKYSVMIDRKDSNRTYLVKEGSLDYSGECLNSPGLIVNMLNQCFHLDDQAEEYVYLVVTDAAMHPLGVFELSHGTVRESLTGMREIFLRVLLCGGVGFVVAHNHPSGNYGQPSGEDLNVCRRIREASKLMDIPILDFLIVGSGGYLSFSRSEML